MHQKLTLFYKKNIFRFLFCLSLSFIYSQSFSQQLSLKIAGSQQAGFHTEVYYGSQLLVTNTEEFSLHLFNSDLSTTTNLQWKGDEWTGNEKNIRLTRQAYLKDFDANLSVEVSYEVVSSNIIKKTIKLFQPSMPGMLYILEQTSNPAENPKRYVTFEYDSFPGGLVHEMFPAAGFITPDNIVVGFLTDAGYKNEYTRNTRRRFSGR